MTLWSGYLCICNVYTYKDGFKKKLIILIFQNCVEYIFRNIFLYICDSLSSTFSKLKLKPLIVIDAWFLPLFVEEIHIPGAKPIMAPTNVGGGGGSVGVLTITWKVSIYKNPLQKGSRQKSESGDFEIRDYSECKIWYSKSKSGNQVINYKVYTCICMYMHAGMYHSNSILL